jgi:hypothetical protein
MDACTPIDANFVVVTVIAGKNFSIAGIKFSIRTIKSANANVSLHVVETEPEPPDPPDPPDPEPPEPEPPEPLYIDPPDPPDPEPPEPEPPVIGGDWPELPPVIATDPGLGIPFVGCVSISISLYLLS